MITDALKINTVYLLTFVKKKKEKYQERVNKAAGRRLNLESKKHNQVSGKKHDVQEKIKVYFVNDF